MTLKLTLLDLVEDEALSLACIDLAERMGYHRYWFTEHGAQPSSVLLAGMAAGTVADIRVGTAGVLLRYWQPYVLANQFHLLSWAYSDRIDAGVCGGGVGELLEPRYTEIPHGGDYPQKVRDFVSYLRQDPEDADPGTIWHNVPEQRAQIWIHGTGSRSAGLAAECGIGLGYSLFHLNSMDITETVQSYRDNFQPNAYQKEPKVVLALAGICMEDEKAAQQKAEWFRAHNKFLVPRLIGSTARIVDSLHHFARRYAVDEVAYLDVGNHGEALTAVIQHLAQEAQLAPR